MFRFSAEGSQVYCLDAARQTGVIVESSHALGPGGDYGEQLVFFCRIRLVKLVRTMCTVDLPFLHTLFGWQFGLGVGGRSVSIISISMILHAQSGERSHTSTLLHLPWKPAPTQLGRLSLFLELVMARWAGREWWIASGRTGAPMPRIGQYLDANSNGRSSRYPEAPSGSEQGACWVRKHLQWLGSVCLAGFFLRRCSCWWEGGQPAPRDSQHWYIEYTQGWVVLGCQILGN